MYRICLIVFLVILSGNIFANGSTIASTSKINKENNSVLAEGTGIRITINDYKIARLTLPEKLKEIEKTAEGKRELLDTLITRELVLLDAKSEGLNSLYDGFNMSNELIKRVIVDDYLQRHGVRAKNKTTDVVYDKVKSDLRTKYRIVVFDSVLNQLN